MRREQRRPVTTLPEECQARGGITCRPSLSSNPWKYPAWETLADLGETHAMCRLECLK